MTYLFLKNKVYPTLFTIFVAIKRLYVRKVNLVPRIESNQY